MHLLKYFAIILLHIVIHPQCTPLSQEGQPSRNPEENLGIYQGDMLLQPNDGTPTGKGVASRPAYQRWVDGIIPYEFASNITAHNTAFVVQQMRVMENLIMINKTQCIRFREKIATDQFFITIFNGSGCYAPVGSWGNLVRVRGVSLMHGLYLTCMVSGIVQHELMHVLGFYHEQSRPDRDSYVSIQWANIDPSVVSAFEKYDDSTVDTLMTSYDYGSVMHYEWNAFAINSSAPTIIPTQNATAYIGQRVGLSPIDIIEIQRYYNCVATADSVTTTTRSTTTTATIITTIASTTMAPVTTRTTTNAIATGTTTMTTTNEPKNAATGSILFTPVQLFLVVMISMAYHFKQCPL